MFYIRVPVERHSEARAPPKGSLIFDNHHMKFWYPTHNQGTFLAFSKLPTGRTIRAGHSSTNATTCILVSWHKLTKAQVCIPQLSRAHIPKPNLAPPFPAHDFSNSPAHLKPRHPLALFQGEPSIYDAVGQRSLLNIRDLQFPTQSKPHVWQVLCGCELGGSSDSALTCLVFLTALHGATLLDVTQALARLPTM